MNTTEDYYNKNAMAYKERTFSINMQEFYTPFLAYLPPGAHILDAGCGPGRDTRFFKNEGYQVTAFDASLEMVKLSTQEIGQKTLHLTFQSLAFNQQFDGIWASDSLLHVPFFELKEVIKKFILL